jgi:hypothetical protein
VIVTNQRRDTALGKNRTNGEEIGRTRVFQEHPRTSGLSEIVINNSELREKDPKYRTSRVENHGYPTADTTVGMLDMHRVSGCTSTSNTKVHTLPSTRAFKLS